jgi:hypothetical protein
MKLIDIFKELVNEGVRRSEGVLKVSPQNNRNDLLLTTNGDTERQGNTIYYTFEYNPEYKNGEEVKLAADELKDLDNAGANIDKVTLGQTISDSLSSFISRNFGEAPDVVYYLGSSKGLSGFIANIVKDKYPGIEVLPLNKKKFPSWEDMLVPNYKELIKSPTILKLAQDQAKELWDNNDKEIKSSQGITRVRHYFKSKYELEKILSREKMLFVDDNVQQGIDFGHIADSLADVRKLMFYAAILLPREGAKTTKATQQEKQKFCFKNVDSKYFKTLKDSKGNASLYVSYAHPDFLMLRNTNKVEDTPQNLGGTSYYKFKPGTKITSLEDVQKKKCKD